MIISSVTKLMREKSPTFWAIRIKNYLEESKWLSIGQLLATLLSKSKTALSFKKGSTILAFVVPVKVGKGDYNRVLSFSVILKTMGKGYLRGWII